MYNSASASLGLPMVYLVDDEDVVRDALAWLLRSRRLLSEGFSTAEAFEAMLESQLPSAAPTLGLAPSLATQGQPGGHSSLSSTAASSAQSGAPSVAHSNAPLHAQSMAPSAAHSATHSAAHSLTPTPAERPDIDWPRSPSCLLLDVRMPGTSGLVLFERLAERGLLSALPVIFLTGHGDVPTAVGAVKRGAFDFVEKPFSDNALVDRVEQALAESAAAIGRRRDRQVLTRRVAELTEREREVMRLVTLGHTNKLIADQLAISVRTVEVHRAHLFEKMQVASAVELANLLRRVPG